MHRKNFAACYGTKKFVSVCDSFWGIHNACIVGMTDMSPRLIHFTATPWLKTCLHSCKKETCIRVDTSVQLDLGHP